MMYLAKCTTIVSWVKAHYDITHNHIKRGATDYYVEVDTPEEAQILEAINERTRDLRNYKKYWIQVYAHAHQK